MQVRPPRLRTPRSELAARLSACAVHARLVSHVQHWVLAPSSTATKKQDYVKTYFVLFVMRQ